MFPKLMSLAGNTIILDIICEPPLAACAVFIPVWFSDLVSKQTICLTQSNLNTRLLSIR